MESQRGTILVVDDDRLSRILLATSLEEEGYAVETAENGRQALHQLHARSFDVVLLDVMMPEVDGYQVLAQLKADPQLQHLPVIMISAVDDMASVIQCIELGATDYLPKPFDPALLRARINASLASKRLRDLEVEYLKAEALLRQREKMAALGKLSAGLAHELNNPASAVGRAAAQLRDSFQTLVALAWKFNQRPLTPEQLQVVADLQSDALARSALARPIDALAQSDREEQLADWLDAHGVDDSWRLAPTLVRAGLDTERLASVAAAIDPAVLGRDRLAREHAAGGRVVGRDRA